jgi:hypothetical protein
MWNVLKSQDGLAGAVFVLLGIAGLLFGRDLRMGSAVEMGAGYFPIVVSIALVLIGVVIVVKSMIALGETVSRITLRPLVVLTASLLIFALCFRPLGLVLTTFATIMVAGFAPADARFRPLLLLAVGMTAFCAVAFVVLLRLPLQLWPAVMP